MRQTIAIFVFLLLVDACGLGQGSPPSDLQRFTSANQQFGMKLLEKVHAATPEKNVAIAPLPVTFVLAAIDSETDSPQIQDLFGWRGVNLGAVAQMLTARFVLRPEEAAKRAAAQRRLQRCRGPVKKGCAVPVGGDELSLANTFWYRGTNHFSKTFIRAASESFGLEFHSVPNETPAPNVGPPPEWSREVTVPEVDGPRDFSVTSIMRLRSTWRGNAFGTRRKGQFTLRDGTRRSLEFMLSEPNDYEYAKTEGFEAVMLPGNTASLLVAVAAEGSSLKELEEGLARGLDIRSQLVRKAGVVEMPPIHVTYTVDERAPMLALGISDIFKDLGRLVDIKQSHFTSFLQRVDVEVDERGIRANAGTVSTGVYGGIRTVQEPFHMVANRPFLFFLYDNVTSALLFAGAVQDPTKP